MSTAAIEWYKGCADKTEWQMSHGGFHIGSTAFTACGMTVQTSKGIN